MEDSVTRLGLDIRTLFSVVPHLLLLFVAARFVGPFFT